MDALTVIDEAAPARVVVFGSLPPAGRDLDLVVPDADVGALTDGLGSAGFESSGNAWAWFGGGTAVGVDVVPVSAWGLGPSAEHALFEESVPLEGRTRVARPSPEHALLILARRLERSHAPLAAKHRAKIDAALAEDPNAWEAAAADAPAWRAERALAALRRAHAGETRGVAFPRPHRPGIVVALSGLDGAGKSSQASALADALSRLGHRPRTVWTPLGNNPVQRRVAALAKRALRRGDAGSTALSRGRGSEGASGTLAAGAWSAFGGLVNGGWHLWSAVPGVARGEVVIFDRYVLDSVVHLHFAYGPSAVPAALVRALSLRPARSYLLAVRPETALARKDDLWSLEELQRQAELYRHYAGRLGVTILDGEQPPEELSATIARDVWRRLHRAA